MINRGCGQAVRQLGQAQALGQKASCNMMPTCRWRSWRGQDPGRVSAPARETQPSVRGGVQVQARCFMCLGECSFTRESLGHLRARVAAYLHTSWQSAVHKRAPSFVHPGSSWRLTSRSRPRLEVWAARLCTSVGPGALRAGLGIHRLPARACLIVRAPSVARLLDG